MWIMKIQKMFYSLWVLIAWVAILYLWKSFLIPLSMSIFIWLILSFFVTKLEEYFSNSIATLVVVVSFFVLLWAVFTWFWAWISYIQSNTSELFWTLNEIYTTYESKLANQTFITVDQISAWSAAIQEWITFEQISWLAWWTVSWLSTAVIIVMLSILLLTHENRINISMKKVMGPHYMKLFWTAKTTIAQYSYWLMVLILILFVLNTIWLLIFWVPNALFIWGLTSIATLIPTIWTIFGWLVAASVWWFASGSLYVVVGIAVWYLLVQQLEDYVIKPKIIWEKVSLNTLTVILWMLGWWLLRWVPGLFLAIPILWIIQKMAQEKGSPIADLLWTRKLDKD